MSTSSSELSSIGSLLADRLEKYTKADKKNQLPFEYVIGFITQQLSQKLFPDDFNARKTVDIIRNELVAEQTTLKEKVDKIEDELYLEYENVGFAQQKEAQKRNRERLLIKTIKTLNEQHSFINEQDIQQLETINKDEVREQIETLITEISNALKEKETLIKDIKKLTAKLEKSTIENKPIDIDVTDQLNSKKAEFNTLSDTIVSKKAQQKRLSQKYIEMGNEIDRIYLQYTTIAQGIIKEQNSTDKDLQSLFIETDLNIEKFSKDEYLYTIVTNSDPQYTTYRELDEQLTNIESYIKQLDAIQSISQIFENTEGYFRDVVLKPRGEKVLEWNTERNRLIDYMKEIVASKPTKPEGVEAFHALLSEPYDDPQQKYALTLRGYVKLVINKRYEQIEHREFQLRGRFVINEFNRLLAANEINEQHQIINEDEDEYGDDEEKDETYDEDEEETKKMDEEEDTFRKIALGIMAHNVTDLTSDEYSFLVGDEEEEAGEISSSDDEDDVVDVNDFSDDEEEEKPNINKPKPAVVEEKAKKNTKQKIDIKKSIDNEGYGILTEILGADTYVETNDFESDDIAGRDITVVDKRNEIIRLFSGLFKKYEQPGYHRNRDDVLDITNAVVFNLGPHYKIHQLFRMELVALFEEMKRLKGLFVIDKFRQASADKNQYWLPEIYEEYFNSDRTLNQTYTQFWSTAGKPAGTDLPPTARAMLCADDITLFKEHMQTNFDILQSVRKQIVTVYLPICMDCIHASGSAYAVPYFKRLKFEDYFPLNNQIKFTKTQHLEFIFENAIRGFISLDAMKVRCDLFDFLNCLMMGFFAIDSMIEHKLLIQTDKDILFGKLTRVAINNVAALKCPEFIFTRMVKDVEHMIPNEEIIPVSPLNYGLPVDVHGQLKTFVSKTISLSKRPEKNPFIKRDDWIDYTRFTAVPIKLTLDMVQKMKARFYYSPPIRKKVPKTDEELNEQESGYLKTEEKSIEFKFVKDKIISDMFVPIEEIITTYSNERIVPDNFVHLSGGWFESPYTDALVAVRGLDKIINTIQFQCNVVLDKVDNFQTQNSPPAVENYPQFRFIFHKIASVMNEVYLSHTPHKIKNIVVAEPNFTLSKQVESADVVDTILNSVNSWYNKEQKAIQNIKNQDAIKTFDRFFTGYSVEKFVTPKEQPDSDVRKELIVIRDNYIKKRLSLFKTLTEKYKDYQLITYHNNTWLKYNGEYRNEVYKKSDVEIDNQLNKGEDGQIVLLLEDGVIEEKLLALKNFIEEDLNLETAFIEKICAKITEKLPNIAIVIWRWQFCKVESIMNRKVKAAIYTKNKPPPFDLQRLTELQPPILFITMLGVNAYENLLRNPLNISKRYKRAYGFVGINKNELGNTEYVTSFQRTVEYVAFDPEIGLDADFYYPESDDEFKINPNELNNYIRSNGPINRINFLKRLLCENFTFNTKRTKEIKELLTFAIQLANTDGDVPEDTKTKARRYQTEYKYKLLLTQANKDDDEQVLNYLKMNKVQLEFKTKAREHEERYRQAELYKSKDLTNVEVEKRGNTTTSIDEPNKRQKYGTLLQMKKCNETMKLLNEIIKYRV